MSESSAKASAFALAAAALFLAACHHEKPTTTPGTSDAAATDAAATDKPVADTSAAKIKCFGANACTGQGACDVPDGRVAPGSKGHDCAGNNACKGKGWVLLNGAECTASGGQPL